MTSEKKISIHNNHGGLKHVFKENYAILELNKSNLEDVHGCCF